VVGWEAVITFSTRKYNNSQLWVILFLGTKWLFTADVFWYTCICDSNMISFFRFVDKRAIYRWYNLIRTCAGECNWLFHWQHKLCATFSANVNIN
jgi:hypothetical protein